jgi:hypothetical protein
MNRTAQEDRGTLFVIGSRVLGSKKQVEAKTERVFEAKLTAAEKLVLLGLISARLDDEPVKLPDLENMACMNTQQLDKTLSQLLAKDMIEFRKSGVLLKV